MLLVAVKGAVRKPQFVKRYQCIFRVKKPHDNFFAVFNGRTGDANIKIDAFIRCVLEGKTAILGQSALGYVHLGQNFNSTGNDIDEAPGLNLLDNKQQFAVDSESNDHLLFIAAQYGCQRHTWHGPFQESG